MMDALYIGATGMAAQQTTVDTISNNLANVNTPAYKKSRVSFEDMVYRPVVSKNIIDSVDQPEGKRGTGVGVLGVGKLFTLGDLKKTDNPLDVSINGQGFLEVIMPDGNVAFTRAGSLEVNRDGLLSAAGGNPLKQMIRVPPDTANLIVDSNGTVRANVANEKAPVELGQLELAMFPNPAGMNPIGENLYLASERSGDPFFSKPGEDGTGVLAQGYLESSNVKLVEEMINLMLAQRAYEVNAKVVQAADDLLAMSNNLRR
ncbi:MAG: flagellar basal-body rod protein FlgG [Pseudomonadota bacterium]